MGSYLAGEIPWPQPLLWDSVRLREKHAALCSFPSGGKPLLTLTVLIVRKKYMELSGEKLPVRNNLNIKEFTMYSISFQAAKICNNMLLAISMIGTAEAMNLGIRFVE